MVPWPPESVTIWAADLYGARNADDIGELELLYMLAVSFIVVAGATLLARYTLRFLKRPHTAQA
jgi:hypothetical protein